MRRFLFAVTAALFVAAYLAFIGAIITAKIDDGSRWLCIGALTLLLGVIAWVAAYNFPDPRRHF